MARRLLSSLLRRAAKRITREEAVALATVLPAPLHASWRMTEYGNQILERMSRCAGKRGKKSMRSNRWDMLLQRVCGSPAGAVWPERRAGHWTGNIDSPAGSMAIEVDLDKTASGWIGSLSIPAQGRRIPLDPVHSPMGKSRSA